MRCCDCIHPTKDELDFDKEAQLYVDPDHCIDCGMCVDECPVKALFSEDDLPDEWKHFAQINADYYMKNK